MNDLQKIFENRIRLSVKDSKLPVACSINDVYESISNLTKHRKNFFCPPFLAKKLLLKKTKKLLRKVSDIENS